MRALVTGGAGFIGSNLVDALLARGDEVSIVDDLSTGRRENLAADATFHEASITDGPHMAELLAEERPEAVFHLAAQVDVRRAVADPAFDAAVNVGGTAVMLEAARAAGTRRFVLASTGGAIYGDTDRLPTPEDVPAAPISPYGASKAAAESYLALYARLHGLSTVALRFANVYGPRQDPLGEGGVIAIYCHAAANSRQVRVFGDGRQTRDFVYVGDVAAALLAAADREVDRRLQHRHRAGDHRARARGAARARADLRARAARRDPALVPGSRARRARRWAGRRRHGARRRAAAHDARLERRRGAGAPLRLSRTSVLPRCSCGRRARSCSRRDRAGRRRRGRGPSHS